MCTVNFSSWFFLGKEKLKEKLEAQAWSLMMIVGYLRSCRFQIFDKIVGFHNII